MDDLHLGNACFVDDECEAALEHYTRAIAALGSADAYSKRAAAHLQLGNHKQAAADAAAAIELDPSLAKAHMRKGRASFALEDFVTARSAFAKALESQPASAALKRWVRKCDAELEGETTSPPPPAPKPAGAAAAAAAASAAPPSSSSSAPLGPPTDESKLRHEWYQTATHVVVSVLARGLAKEAVSVEFGEASADVAIKLGGGVEYQLSLSLFQKVVPSECKWSVGAVKVELKLKKRSPGKWEALEGSGDAEVAQMNAAPVADAAPSKSVYSGSSRNWDAIDSELKQKEEEEKPEGEEALNKLFRDIYGRSDEETRRAMNKSFQTSGGTVLSTNWGEVKAKDYENEKTAPDGQEWKKWG